MDSTKLPPPIADYIKEHFRGSLLTNVTERKGPSGHAHYDVQVSHDGTIHYMEFNEHGALVSRREEDAFPDEESLIDPTAD